MHDCALGREGGPSAPRVEHRYYGIYGYRWGYKWSKSQMFFKNWI